MSPFIIVVVGCEVDKSVKTTVFVKLINCEALVKVKLLPLDVPFPDEFSIAVKLANQYFAFVSDGLAVGGVVCQPESRFVNAPVPKVNTASLFASGPAGAFCEPTL